MCSGSKPKSTQKGGFGSPTPQSKETRGGLGSPSPSKTSTTRPTQLKTGRPKLNYRSGSYGRGYKPPMKTGRSDGRGFMKSPAGRYVGGQPGTGRGPGRRFQPGVYVNSGRDRGTTFIPYIPSAPAAVQTRPEEEKKPAPVTAAPIVSAPVDDTDPRYPNPDGPQPRPPADTISPGPRPGPPDGDGGGRAIRIRESVARRTAFGRGARARGSRRSARVDGQRQGSRLARSVSGLGKQSRSRLGINV